MWVSVLSVESSGLEDCTFTNCTLTCQLVSVLSVESSGLEDLVAIGYPAGAQLFQYSQLSRVVWKQMQ